MSVAPVESELNPPIPQRVSAILVSHNGARWLPEVVAALSSQLRGPDFLIAVDTGSTDSSRDLLHNSRIDLIDAPQSSGFGEAVALAVAQLPPVHRVISESGESSERESEWLWLLHDDCAPTPDSLAELLHAVAERPNVGVAGPKILGWHDRSHLLEIGITLAHNGARWTGLERNERDQGQHDGDGVIPVLAVSTAGALIRRDLFEEIGGFDPNLPLFRDDVDFGMRARMAGYEVICVTGAKLFHAEAAATERRPIDVAGGAFHRPHLLDRRHAAFVLLANLPLWTLPWIALRIFASSLMRAIGYLLAKLPGYALDELTAVALLFTRLDRLRIARTSRRKKRLLPARVIRPFLAPWSEQIKLGALTTDSDESELLAPSHSHFWRETFTRPLFLASFSLTIFSLIASRARFGHLAGGALAIAGESSGALLRSYGESWHALGVGSPKAMHPFSALLAIVSFITGGSPARFVTLLMIFAPVFAMWSMYLLVRKIGAGPWISATSALIYGSSALLLISINVGYLSTVMLIIVAPIALLAFKDENYSEIKIMSWRRTCAIALLLAVLSALSFQIFLLAIILIAVHLWMLRREGNLLTRYALQYGTILLGSFCALAPWSFSHITSPKSLLLDQGIPVDFGSPLRVLTGNLQPLNAIPTYVIGISLIMGVVALFSRRAFTQSWVILGTLAMAGLISALSISPIGNSLTSEIWPGGFLTVSICYSSIAFARLSMGRLRRLRDSSLGRAHFATAIVAIIVLYSVSTNLFWWATSAASAPVRSVSSSVLPAFISTATTNPDRPKTLILKSEEQQGVKNFAYVVLRDRDLQMGQLSALPAEVPLLTKSVSQITAGVGDAPAATLAEFGIRYLYLEDGKKNNSLARKIDGIGGLTRLSATSDGILWQISGLTSRIKFSPRLADGEKNGKLESNILVLPSEVLGAEFDVPSPGTVQLAEVFNPHWRALHAGKVLFPTKSELGLTQFEIPDMGRVVLFHEGTAHRAGIALQLAALGLLLFFALPRGRRQSELPDEEVS
ncbi:MAG: glycosyltransferase family 2 protein [Actinobacteria bacterium]|uniref:Glycosyltransferase family 2 protein n=1 Tax=Candidatus Fonsibacter lacus TaxID=2576439 RepID=A0A965GC48_9PROT|nr:glycosyltransferase family 2 protein [Candidatus Fonsibacter lacus]